MSDGHSVQFFSAEDSSDLHRRLFLAIDDPRQRELLIPMLDDLDKHADPEFREQIFQMILDTRTTVLPNLPCGAVILAHSLEGMRTKPSDATVILAAERLLDAAANRDEIWQFPSLQGVVLAALQALTNAGRQMPVETVLIRALQSAAGDVPRANAAADIALRLRILTPAIAKGLVSALLGDSADWNFPVDRALREMASQTPSLLQSEQLRMRNILKVQPLLVEQISSDPVWLRVIVALYGGLGPDPAAGPDARLPFRFSPERIHRDSPLTDLIIQVVRDARASALRDGLEARLATSSDIREQADILIALAAGGSDLADVFLRCPISGEAIDLFLKALPRIADAIAPAVQAALPTMRADIQRMYLADEEARVEFLAMLQDLLLVHGHILSNPALLSTEVPSGKRYLRHAQFWRYLFSSGNPDPGYATAFVLDTAGDVLSSIPWDLAWSLARAQEVPSYELTVWSPEPFPPMPTTNFEALSEALNALSSVRPRFDFFRGWAVEGLGACIHEHQDLLPETLCIIEGISDPESRARAHNAFSFDRGPNKRFDFQTMIWQRIEKIRDVPTRARAIWRAASIVPDVFARDCLEQARELTRLIPDPAERSRMYWRLARAARSSDSARELMLNAIRAAIKIESPDGFVRAMARLSDHVDPIAQRQLMAAATAMLPSIKDETDRARSTARLRPLLTSQPDLVQRVDKTATGINGGWQRAIALQTPVALLEDAVQIGVSPHTWSPIQLLAIVDDVLGRYSVPISETDLWLALHDSERRSACVNALREAGSFRLNRLSSIAAARLNQLLMADDIEHTHVLLQSVGRPGQATVPNLRQWLVHDVVEIRQCAALLLLEAGEISVEIVSEIHALLRASDDRLRSRAIQALTDRYYSGNLRTSRIPIEAIEATFERVIDGVQIDLQAPPMVSRVFRLFRDALIHDDKEKVRQWATEAINGSSIARQIISRIWSIETSGWDGFVSLLELFDEQHAELQCLALRTLHFVLYSNTDIPDSARSAIGRHIHLALSKGEPELSRQALLALSHARELRPEDVDVLRDILASNDDRAPWAVLALGRNHYEEFTDVLTLRRSDSRPNVVVAADAMYVQHRVSKLAWNAPEDELQTVFEEIAATLDMNPDRIFVAALFATNRSLDYPRDNFLKEIGGMALAQSPTLMETAVEKLVELLTTEMPLSNQFERFAAQDHSIWRHIFSQFISSAVSRNPEAFAGIAVKHQGEEIFAETALSNLGAGIRQAALVCLGHLGTVTPRVALALQRGAQDVYIVQQAAFEAADRMRTFSALSIGDLAAGLFDNSLAVAYCTARMLAAIGDVEQTPSAVRAEIVAALSKAMLTPGAQKNVYLQVFVTRDESDSAEQGVAVRDIGRLDDLLGQLLVRMARLEPLASDEGSLHRHIRHYHAAWLEKKRGGTIPPSALEEFKEDLPPVTAKRETYFSRSLEELGSVSIMKSWEYG